MSSSITATIRKRCFWATLAGLGATVPLASVANSIFILGDAQGFLASVISWTVPGRIYWLMMAWWWPS